MGGLGIARYDYVSDLPMKKAPCGASSFDTLAEWTGLEPATPGVTGRYSNQLNYHSMWRQHPGSGICTCAASVAKLGVP
jgi:hypothetical protein